MTVLSDTQLEQARKDETGRPTELHCAYCGATDHINTVGLRGKGDTLIGFVFACSPHIGHLVGHKLKFERT